MSEPLRVVIGEDDVHRDIAEKPGLGGSGVGLPASAGDWSAGIRGK
jgi:hypothetical protein